MRKAITPVISIIILLLITISLAGMGWTYMSGYYEAMTAKQIKVVEGSAFGNEVMVLNMGTGEIGTDELRILVNGKEAEIMNPHVIEPKKSARIVFSPPEIGDNLKVRVLSPGNSISYTEDMEFRSCKDVSGNYNGTYLIDPDGPGGSAPFEVLCDMETDGGGWTGIEFASDLPHINRWLTGDGWKWVDSDFQTVLSTAQIQAIQAVSTEGRQVYDGTCEGVLHWYYESGGTYHAAFGFRFLNGDTTNYASSDLGVDFTVLEDECRFNDGVFRRTAWEIRDVRVPIVNAYSHDNGNAGELFGSELTKNPAWLR